MILRFYFFIFSWPFFFSRKPTTPIALGIIIMTGSIPYTSNGLYDSLSTVPIITASSKLFTLTVFEIVAEEYHGPLTVAVMTSGFFCGVIMIAASPVGLVVLSEICICPPLTSHFTFIPTRALEFAFAESVATRVSVALILYGLEIRSVGVVLVTDIFSVVRGISFANSETSVSPLPFGATSKRL